MLSLPFIRTSTYDEVCIVVKVIYMYMYTYMYNDYTSGHTKDHIFELQRKI